MVVRRLSPSPVLGIERFANAEEFRPNEVIGGGVSVPLDPKNASAARAILSLPNSLLVLQRSFARRLETNLGSDYGLGMLIPLSFEATINGQQINNSTIIATRGRTPTTAIEYHPNTYLMLRLNSDMRNRGWANFDAGIVPINTTLERIRRLGAIIWEMFEFAAKAHNLDDAREHMNETLLTALDSVLSFDQTKPSLPRSFRKYRRLVDNLDEIARLNPTNALYGDKMAHDLQVSLRTLQSAIRVVHGMSLNRYLVSKRLWSVRRVLKRGSRSMSVKATALANGFWHLGEFSHVYKVQFGELPSDTLARARSYTPTR
jgi:AraC-like DNA-binding protein